MAKTKNRDQGAQSDLPWLIDELFSVAELRQWIHAHYPEVARELPGEIASHSEIVFVALDRLRRRGVVKAEFFERLCEARPRRRAEILAVRTQILDATSTPLLRWSSAEDRRLGRAPDELWTPRVRLFRYLVGTCALLWLIAIAYSGGQLAALQKGVFSFLPVKYQRFGFLGAAGLALVVSGLCRLFARMDKKTRS